MSIYRFFRHRRPSFRRIIIVVVIGSITLPAVILGAVFMVAQGGYAKNPPQGSYVAAFEAWRAVSPDSGGKLAARKDYKPLPWLDLVVCDLEGRAVYSDIEPFSRGKAVDAGEIARLAGLGAPGTAFFSDTFRVRGKAEGIWYAIVHSGKSNLHGGELMPWARLAAPLLVVSVVFLLSVAAAAFMASQIGRLERAAVAIASGDLETPVRAGGTREIVRLADAMETMRASIREDLARRARFLAAVSHDLRTPLTSIGGYIEAIEDGLAEDREILGEYLSIMKEKAEVLGERIQSLIEFAKMETGEWRGRFESLPLLPLISSFAEAAAEECALSGAAFESGLGALRNAEARVDRELLSRVFENLVSNALRHGKPGGLIRMSARAVQGKPGGFRLAIDVDDEGPGIQASERERVFEAYWRGKSSARGEGNGLGLYIARTIIRGHGWDLVVGDSPLGGARLTVFIPLSRDPGKDPPNSGACS